MRGQLESEVVDATDQGSYLIGTWGNEKGEFVSMAIWKNGPVEKVVPAIDGYTHTQAEQLSADDSVLCTALRSPGASASRGSSLAFVWRPRSDQISLLPLLDGFSASYGYSISHDGRSACGFQAKAGSGNVPVVWTGAADGSWSCQQLPVIHDDNPFLVTAGVRISPNGMIIVAPITVQMKPGALNGYVSATHLWTKSAAGQWERQLRTDEGLVVHAVNDHGAFVGHCNRVVNGVAYPRAYICTMDRGFQEIGVLDGDVASDACDINNSAVVVGWSTDPYGPADPQKDIGYDDPFVWTPQDGMRKIVVAGTPSRGAHGSAKTITDGNRVGGRVTVVDELDEPAFTAELR